LHRSEGGEFGWQLRHNFGKFGGVTILDLEEVDLSFSIELRRRKIRGGWGVSFEIIESLPYLRFRLRVNTDVDAEASWSNNALMALSSTGVLFSSESRPLRTCSPRPIERSPSCDEVGREGDG
jgi:hypothetical protein